MRRAPHSPASYGANRRRRPARVRYLVLLGLLGLVAYAYLHPQVVARTRGYLNVGVVWVGQQTRAGIAALRATRAYAWIVRVLPERKKPEPRRRPVPSRTKTPATPPQVEDAPFRTPGQKIADGPGYETYHKTLRCTTRAQMAILIDRMVYSASRSDTRTLKRGRTAYWDPGTRFIVVVDERAKYGGYLLRPSRGRAEFESLQ